VKSTNLGPYRYLLRQLTEARNEADCSQAELGRRLSKPQSYVSKVESGDRRLDLVEFIYWAKALHVDPTAFVAALADSLGSVPRLSKPRKTVTPRR
jgi:transcriptional regulator with XRE-family HTH domain